MNPTLFGFIKKELTQALRDRRMRIIIFAIPIVQLTIFGLALSNEIKNVRLQVIYEPGDSLARGLEERCLGSGWFVPAQQTGLDPFEVLKKGRADVVILTPPGGLSRSVARGDGQVQVLIDASNAIRARAIENYVRAILYRELFDQQGLNTRPLISMDVRMLFNASMRTPVYLVPGVMCMILCLITILLTSMSMAREKETGTFETLLSAPIKTWEILVGKTLPYVLLGLLDVPLILGVAIFGFDVPMRGAVWEIALASFVFVCTTVAVGTLISTFAKNQQQAMMGSFLFLFPAIQLSGVMAPLDNIPLLFKVVAQLNPLQHFVALMRNIMLKGGDSSVVINHIAAMSALCVVAMTVTSIRFRKTLN